MANLTESPPAICKSEPVTNKSTISSSESAAMTPRSKPPFRFLDLPAEIRRIVYEQLFAGCYLELEERACNCMDSKDSLAYWSAHLPGVLTACKLVRAEALPIFSACLTPVTYDLFPKTAAAKIPAHYLKYCKVALIDEQSAELLDKTQLPSLEELHVHLCWDMECLGGPRETDLNVSEEEALDTIMAHYETVNVHYILKEAKEKGTIPARIMMETRLDVVCEGCDTCGWWQNILIDLDKREIISEIEKDALAHNPGCVKLEDSDSEVDAESEGEDEGQGEVAGEGNEAGNE